MKMRFHSHGNEFNLHVSEISFSYERIGTKTRFEKEAKGNSEMAYCNRVFSYVKSELTVYVGRFIRVIWNFVCKLYRKHHNYLQ